MKLIILTIALLIVAAKAQEDHCNNFAACDTITGPCQAADDDCGADKFCCVNKACHSHCEHVHDVDTTVVPAV
ncbi:hypothetical protein BaRGS_00021684 [Batillaria attramentaria]|uniref:WAP domain-containing protein n=1 Tax=Batillaria attramentaria TaxID=370345 RepID=A0ABD0KIY3_9CAEN